MDTTQPGVVQSSLSGNQAYPTSAGLGGGRREARTGERGLELIMLGDHRGARSEADALVKEATRLTSPSLWAMRMKGDWAQATPLFERAALLYRQVGDCSAAKNCWTRAADGHKAQNSPWHAAKVLERAGEAAQQDGDWAEVESLFHQASELYLLEDRPQNAAECIVRGAKALENVSTAEKIFKMYSKALEWLEDSGKDVTGMDVYREAIRFAVDKGLWNESHRLLLRFAAACARSRALNSLCKSYLGAVVVCLYDCQFTEAWSTHQDALQVEEFAVSEEARAAAALLHAYGNGDEQGIKSCIKERACFFHMEPSLARLAKRLPNGEIGAAVAALNATTVEEEDLT